MQCTKPRKILTGFGGGKFRKWLEVPCGKCMGCRIARSTEWKIRLLDELKYWKAASFLTLTYTDDDCPKGLEKNDLIRFNRALRDKFGSIKYYSVGEYGSASGRPHYHGIYFGVGPLEERDERISSIWKKGYVFCGAVNKDSVLYVCGYIRKKLIGRNSYPEEIAAPFSLMSKGLGERFWEDNKEKIISGKITQNGKKICTPRYYKKKFTEKQKAEERKKAKKLEHERTHHAYLRGKTYEEAKHEDEDRRESELSWKYNPANSRKKNSL